MNKQTNTTQRFMRAVVLVASLLLVSTAAAYGQGVASTPHYRVYIGLRALQYVKGQKTPLDSEGAAQSGSGHLLTAAIFRRSDGKRVNKATVTVIVIPDHEAQSVHKSMFPVDIQGDVTFEAVLALSPGNYTIRISVKGPHDVQRETATFNQGVS